MDLQSIFRMASRSRLQMCLRSVSISCRHLCVLSSTQLSSKTPIISLVHQPTSTRRFSTYKEPECSSKKFNHDSPNVNIFSPNRRYDMTRTIFVGGLSKFTTEKLLYEHFLQFGTINGCKLARNKQSGAFMDYGFVEFESAEQAESISKLQSHVIDDKEVNVRMRSRQKLQQEFKLFVGGLSKETSVETLREYFSKFGQIAECAIPRDEVDGSRGFGFVLFMSQESVNNALNSAPHNIDNKDVYVKQTGTRQRKFTLIVKKLSPNTTNESLHLFYSRFGQLTECEVKFDRKTGQPRGFGYVGFDSQEDLNSALYAQPHVIDGTEVEINYATSEFEVAITSLPPDITEEALREHFSRYGELQRCEIKETSPGARTGFVGFHSQKDILRALSDRPHIISGKVVNTHQKDQQFIVYVGNLPHDATDYSLLETFSKFGKIVHLEVKRDHTTNRSRGFGYVAFEKAEQAVQALNGETELKGRTLRVEPYKTLALSKKSFK